MFARIQDREERMAVPESVYYANIVTFVEDPNNVAVLLALLEESDKKVRFFTTKLLTVLMANQSAQVQVAVLQSPTNIIRLMDLVKNGSEMIRNGKGDLTLLRFSPGGYRNCLPH